MSRRGDSSPPGGEGDRHSSLSYTKAVVLVAVAVALGAYLLQLGSIGASPSGHTAAPPSTTTTTSPAQSTTTTGVGPTQSVKVLVANASNTNGVAAYYTSKLAAAGWGTLTATNADTRAASSTVYYATGQQGAANVIASELGLAASAVQALGTTTPVKGTTGASVVVVVGDDLAAKVTPATTTTG